MSVEEIKKMGAGSLILRFYGWCGQKYPGERQKWTREQTKEKWREFNLEMEKEVKDVGQPADV